MTVYRRDRFKEYLDLKSPLLQIQGGEQPLNGEIAVIEHQDDKRSVSDSYIFCSYQKAGRRQARLAAWEIVIGHQDDMTKELVIQVIFLKLNQALGS